MAPTAHGGQELTLLGLLWPIGLGLVLLVFYVVAKLLQNSEGTRATNPNLGGHYFEHFFLAPDVIVFSASLLISSRAIESVLNSKGISNNFGDEFSNWFFLLLLCKGLLFALVLVIWHRSESQYKAFPVVRQQPTRATKSGELVKVTEYSIDIVAGLRSSIGFWNLVVGNFLGFLALAMYATFIFYAFVRRP